MVVGDKNLHTSNRHGFTIVELLIVVVIIAILAAITIVAYNGIQQRTQNSVTSDAVSKAIRLLYMYKTENGAFPPIPGAGMACIGLSYANGVCATGTDGVTPVVSDQPGFDTSLQSVGTIPMPSSKTMTRSDGSVVAGMDWEAGSDMIRYYLAGAGQPCTVAGSTGPYTYGNVTECRIVLS